MHGRQKTSAVSTFVIAFGRGRALVGRPENRDDRAPSAAARCIAPESFDKNARTAATTPISSVSVVRPIRFDGSRRSILSHAPLRDRPPRRPAPMPTPRSSSRRTTSATRVGRPLLRVTRMWRRARHRRPACPSGMPPCCSSSCAARDRACRRRDPRGRSRAGRARDRARARDSTPPGGRVRFGLATACVSSGPRRLCRYPQRSRMPAARATPADPNEFVRRMTTSAFVSRSFAASPRIPRLLSAIETIASGSRVGGFAEKRRECRQAARRTGARRRIPRAPSPAPAAT